MMKTRLPALILCVGSSLCVVPTVEADDGPRRAAVVSMARTGERPVLDGTLDDSCWQAATHLSGFRDKIGRRTRATTDAFVSYDDFNLYLGVRCEEPRVATLRRKYRGHDEPVWSDDCVEAFVDSDCDGQSYFHFIANAAGGRYDGFCAHPRSRGAAAFDFEWRSKAFVGADFWSVEFEIPWQTLNLPAKERNAVGLTVCRSRYADPTAQEYSAWRGWFHRPATFATVRDIRLNGGGHPITYRAFDTGERLMGINELSVQLHNADPKEDYTLDVGLLSGEERVATSRKNLRLPQGRFTSVAQRYGIPIKQGHKGEYLLEATVRKRGRAEPPVLVLRRRFSVSSGSLAQTTLDRVCYYEHVPYAHVNVKMFLSRITIREGVRCGVVLTDENGQELHSESNVTITATDHTHPVPIDTLSDGWYRVRTVLSDRATRNCLSRTELVLRKVRGPFCR